MKRRLFAAFVLLHFALGVPLFGQGVVKLTGLSQLGSNITLTLQNTASLPPTGTASGFRLESSPNLTPGSWAPVAAQFSTLGAGRFQTTITRPPGFTKLFYRIVGVLGTADDPDGDGLSTSFEQNILGTSATLFDSDFDGFSDGQEFAYGSDPFEASIHPVFVSKPTVNFIHANSAATEGTSPHQVQILFDRNYSGTVNYSIGSLSTAVAGVDYAPVAGSLTMNSNSAFIPITLLDNATVNGQRVLIINLQLAGENYFVGGRGSHAVLLSDNDAWWTGTLIPASGEVGGRIFRLKVTRQGATTTAVFGAGSGQDGLPIPVVAGGVGTSSISAGLIPAGQWAGTVNAATAARFSVDSPVLAVSAGSLFGAEQIGRRIQLNAEVALNSPTQSHRVQSHLCVGEYAETLTTSGGAPIATLPGGFLLVRDIPAPLPVLTQLLP
jgi:hypothetical protein